MGVSSDWVNRHQGERTDTDDAMKIDCTPLLKYPDLLLPDPEWSRGLAANDVEVSSSLRKSACR